MSTQEASQTRSVDLVKVLVSFWGAGLLLFYGSVALFNEDAFSSEGAALLLLISIAVGASLLLSPWLQRAAGLVALGLACLWGVTSAIVNRHDLFLLVGALVWGLVAYALPGLILMRRGAVSVQLQTTRQEVVVVIGLMLLVLFLLACMFGLGVA